jgi:D-alanine-D-alanine ligase
MGVLIVYNDPILPASHPDAGSERDVLHAVAAIVAHLSCAGFDLETRAVGHDFTSFCDSLRRSPPDVVFNLFEGLGDDPYSECRFAQLLEDEGVAFTGCSSRTLWQAGRKDVAKQLLRRAGLPTPDYFVINAMPFAERPCRWPAIVKPAFRDASIGIDQGSVVTDAELLRGRVAHVVREYGFPVLVEEFVGGREVSVAVIDWPEVRALWEVETVFSDGHGAWPIVSYDAKWRTDSRDYETTPLRCPAELAPHIASRLADMARHAFRVLGCRDFVTVDFRIDDGGVPYVLEVNPNAQMTPTPSILHSFEMADIPYSDFLVQLVYSAKSRSSRSVQSAVRDRLT